MYFGYHTDVISFRSIFADFDGAIDDPSLVTAVRGFLAQLKAQTESADIFESVTSAVAALRKRRNERDKKNGTCDSDDITVNSVVSAADPRANLIKTGVLVCCFLDAWAYLDGKKVPAGDIQTELGFKNPNPVCAILRGAGYDCTLGKYLHLLATTPLDLPSLHRCAERYWDQMKKPRGLPLPGCLQQPTD
jgi:hypothetical protein